MCATYCTYNYRRLCVIDFGKQLRFVYRAPAHIWKNKSIEADTENKGKTTFAIQPSFAIISIKKTSTFSQREAMPVYSPI